MGISFGGFLPGIGIGIFGIFGSGIVSLLSARHTPQ